VLLEGNVFENSWGDAQDGWGLIWDSMETGSAPWSQVADVTMRYDIVKNTNGGVEIAGGQAYTGHTTPASRFDVHDNLFDNIGGDQLAVGVALLSSASYPLSSVSARHNTVLRNTENMGYPIGAEGVSASTVTLSDNLFATAWPYSAIFRSGGALGAAALNAFAGSSWTAASNLVAHDVVPEAEPAGTLFAADLASLGLAADRSLLSSSPFKAKASDGKDPGADIPAVLAATAGVVRP
jgi:hypothetical protein